MKKYIVPEFDNIELTNAVIMNTSLDPNKPVDDQIFSGVDGVTTYTDNGMEGDE